MAVRSLPDAGPVQGTGLSDPGTATARPMWPTRHSPHITTSNPLTSPVRSRFRSVSVSSRSRRTLSISLAIPGVLVQMVSARRILQ